MQTKAEQRGIERALMSRGGGMMLSASFSDRHELHRHNFLTTTRSRRAGVVWKFFSWGLKAQGCGNEA
eukprot:64553-Hanusia_phi.AAC.3